MSPRTIRPVVAAALLLGLVACSDDAEPAQAAPKEPVTLRIATNDGPDTPTGRAIASYARNVDDLSDGKLRVVPVWEAAGPDPDDWDQAVARTVADGTNQLGYIPTRAFDALEVATLQPLQTPFLLTTQERVRTVVESSLADELMEGLDAVGLTGLGLFPEDLRRVFSYGDPMTRPGDLQGRTVRAPRSEMTAAVLRSVGAETVDTSGDAWAAAVEKGEIHAVESSLPFLADLGPEQTPTVTAGNLVLFPKVNVLVANREAFDGLDGDHRSLLRKAAQVTAADPELAMDEKAAAEAFCGIGGRVVAADERDLAAMRSAMSRAEPPLEPRATRALTDQIAELVADLPAVETVPPCQPGGAGEANATASPAPAQGDEVLVVDMSVAAGADGSVVRAAEPLSSCTTVENRDADADDSDPDVMVFTGTHVVRCRGGEVTVRYRATMQTDAPGVTTGTWRVVRSTLPTVRSGGGELSGDGSACELSGTECVRDTYTGEVRP